MRCPDGPITTPRIVPVRDLGFLRTAQGARHNLRSHACRRPNGQIILMLSWAGLGILPSGSRLTHLLRIRHRPACGKRLVTLWFAAPEVHPGFPAVEYFGIGPPPSKTKLRFHVRRRSRGLVRLARHTGRPRLSPMEPHDPRRGPRGDLQEPTTFRPKALSILNNVSLPIEICGRHFARFRDWF